ncbi:MAG: redoxin domain-containing protein, partial [Gammaproteobacteria bacterium]
SIASIAKDYRVITVAQQSGSADAIRAYLHKHQVDFPVLADPDGSLSRRYGVRAVPASFVVGPRGRIRFVEVGYTTELGLRARLWWAQ